jgi:type II secretory pathway pseudopilin PulG
VELLVVMAIIAILASLAFVALGASGNAAREASTRSVIRILSGALRERVDAFREITASVSQIDPDLPQRGNKTRVFRQEVTTFLRWYENANLIPLPPPPIPRPLPQAAEAYVRKNMFRSLFPQRVEDLYGYNGLLDNGQLDDSPMLARMYRETTPGSGAYIPRDGSWIFNELAARARPSPDTTADDDLAASSELLYLILTDGDVYGLPPAEIDGIDKRLVGDTDTDGNLEFLDGWGRPLQFYNWPTRLIKDNGITFTGTVTVGSTTYTTSSLLVSNLPQVSTGVAVPNGDVEVTATKGRNRVDRDPDDTTRALVRRGLSAPGVLIFPLNFNPKSDFTFDPFVPPQSTFNLLTKRPGSVPAGILIAAQRIHPDSFHDPNTGTMPLVVSAGQDGVLGLHLPTESGSDRLARVIHQDTECQALGDNITNQQRGPQ